MDPLTVGVVAFLSGGLLTGGGMWLVKVRNDSDSEAASEIISSIGTLRSELESARAEATRNLTQPDLLEVACSAEYMKEQGDLLCRELFCRMNRQGDGSGASGTECDSIANQANSVVMLGICAGYWDDATVVNGGLDQNSRYAQCIKVFGDRK